MQIRAVVPAALFIAAALALPAAPADSRKQSTATPAIPAAPAQAAESRAQSLGAIRPSNLVLPQFAVSAFDGDAAVAQIIQNNLALADIATRPSNAAAAAAAAQQDRQAGSVSVDSWASAGVNYVLRGSFAGGNAQAELYDIASKQRIFGNSYSGFQAGENRRLAHKITDDVMTAMTNRPGIFSAAICCLADRAGGTKEIVAMEPDGGALRQITNEQALVAAPVWGKNGTEVFFTSYRDRNPDLYGVTLAGKRFEVSRRPGLNTAPSWNETLQRLAVSLSKDGNSEIYSMTRDGRDLSRLTNTPDADTAPDWSPDGSQIAFTSDREGKPQIYVMSSNGGAATRITGGGYCDSPAWSPDGSRIAYVARESGEFNLYVASVSGGPAIQLTRGQRDNRDPAWAPDSRHIVFSSNRGGAKDLYMINLDTKVARQITRGGGYSCPAWGPLFK